MQDIYINENRNQWKDQHLQSISFPGVFQCVQIYINVIEYSNIVQSKCYVFFSFIIELESFQVV